MSERDGTDSTGGEQRRPLSTMSGVVTHATALVAVIAVCIAFMQYLTSDYDAKVDLFVDLRGAYQAIEERLPPRPLRDHHEYRPVFRDGYWIAIESYWQHSFNEWVAAEDQGLAPELWDELYQPASNGAADKSGFGTVLMYLACGGSSFAGKRSEFLEALAGEDELCEGSKMCALDVARWCAKFDPQEQTREKICNRDETTSPESSSALKEHITALCHARFSGGDEPTAMPPALKRLDQEFFSRNIEAGAALCVRWLREDQDISQKLGSPLGKKLACGEGLVLADGNGSVAIDFSDCRDAQSIAECLANEKVPDNRLASLLRAENASLWLHTSAQSSSPMLHALRAYPAIAGARVYGKSRPNEESEGVGSPISYLPVPQHSCESTK